MLAQRLTPNLEDQIICDQGFLHLAFDKSMSSCKAADATLIRFKRRRSMEDDVAENRHLWHLGMDR